MRGYIAIRHRFEPPIQRHTAAIIQNNVGKSLRPKIDHTNNEKNNANIGTTV